MKSTRTLPVVTWVFVLLVVSSIPAAEPSASDPRAVIMADAVVPFERCVKQLEADGWRLVNKPDQRDDLPVVARRESGRRTPFTGPSSLRYSWVVALEPVQIEAGENTTVTFSFHKPKSTEYLFDTQSDKQYSIDIMDEPVRYMAPEKRAEKISIKQNVPNGVTRKIVLVQQKVELVENGQVMKGGYVKTMTFVVFQRKITSRR